MSADQEIDRLRQWTRDNLRTAVGGHPDINDEMIDLAVAAESAEDFPSDRLKVNPPATESLLQKLQGPDDFTTGQICSKLLRSLRMAAYTHRHGEAPAYEDEPWQVDGESPPLNAGHRSRT